MQTRNEAMRPRRNRPLEEQPLKPSRGWQKVRERLLPNLARAQQQSTPSLLEVVKAEQVRGQRRSRVCVPCGVGCVVGHFGPTHLVPFLIPSSVALLCCLANGQFPSPQTSRPG